MPSSQEEINRELISTLQNIHACLNQIVRHIEALGEKLDIKEHGQNND